MHKRNLLVGYRIFFGLLGSSAVLTEIGILVERGRFIPANFLSFFTIESNLFAVAVLLVSALALVRGGQSRHVAMLRGASTMNMIIVGVVFTLLLSGIKNVEFTALPWDNTVLHYLMPVIVALDWCMDIPKTRIAFKKALVWLLFPIAYVVYSLLRGHYVGWYPYPFLNPSNHGYIGVAVMSAALALGAAVLVWALTQFTGRGVNKRA